MVLTLQAELTTELSLMIGPFTDLQQVYIPLLLQGTEQANQPQGIILTQGIRTIL